MVNLDIGCGTAKKEGFMGLDRAPLPGVDIVADLDKDGLPLRSCSVDEVYSNHVMEHMDDLKAVMEEMHRVLKPGGRAVLRVPHCFSSIAFGDSTHKRFFTFDTFSQFDQRHSRSYYYDFHFEFLGSRMQLYRNWHRPRWFGRFLEWLVNRNQRKGERWLKIIPYKDWEVETVLRKPEGGL